MRQRKWAFKYKADEAYPPVSISRQNPKVARAMLDNVGGRNSEMSAISVYMYDNLLVSSQPELVEVFNRINIVEMHHLQIFASLAKLLGEDPRLWSWENGHRSYWSPGYHLYPDKLPALLDYAINGEMEAIEKYAYQASIIQDENVVRNLMRISQDEKLHLTILKTLRAEYC